MKTRNANKLFKALDDWVNDYNLLFPDLDKMLPKKLQKKDEKYNFQQWDVALCRMQKRSIEWPSRSEDKDDVFCTMVMLRNYVKKHSKDGWVDWKPLMRYI